MAKETTHRVAGAALRALPYNGRVELIEALMSEQPATVEDLARFLGRDPTSLYYHLRPLLAVGLVEEAGEQPTSNRPAKLYQLPASKLEVDPEDTSREAMEVRRKLVRAVMSKALQRQEAGLDDPDLVLGGRRPTIIHSIRIARLKPRGHERVVRKLRELNAVLREEHAADGKAFALTYQMAPFRGRLIFSSKPPRGAPRPPVRHERRADYDSTSSRIARASGQFSS